MNDDCTVVSEPEDLLGRSIERNLRLLMHPGMVYEVRILGTMGRNRLDAGYFDDAAKVAVAVLAYDGRSTGIYFTVNPVQSELLARGNNRIIAYAKDTTHDREVVKRTWFLIDFDPVRPSGISSSDAEHQASLDRASEVRDRLRDEGWADPIVADSGNGTHLIYLIDLPNDEKSKSLVKSCLRALHAEYGTEQVAVDTSVFNAGQLTKVYGTMACKGDNTAQRPHRRSQILEEPEELEVVPSELLEALASREPKQGKASPAHLVTGKAGASPASLSAYASKALESELDLVRHAAPGGRNNQLNSSAYSLGQLVGAGALEEHQVNLELAAAAEEAGLGRVEVESTIRSGLTAGMASPRVLPEQRDRRTPSTTSNGMASKQQSASEGDTLGKQPNGDSPALLDRLLASLNAVPLETNGKPDRVQLEDTAVNLIKEATELTTAEMLKFTNHLKRLRATTKFISAFERAVKEERKQLATQQDEDDGLMKPDTWPYEAEHGQTFLLGVQTDRHGNHEIVRRDTIAEFQAQIVEEAVSEEGGRIFDITGETADGLPFRLEIGATEFADERALKAALTSAAGARAPIHAGMMRHVAPAIQLLSDPEIPALKLYERTGWANDRFLIPGRESEGVRISLPNKLAYDLSGGDLTLGLKCLSLTFEAVQPEVLTPLFSFMLTGPMAILVGWRNDRYAMFVRGTTGTMKTTIGKQMMSLYGHGFQEDSRLIKWGEGSTSNALMKLASHAHDLPILFDNFKTSTGRGSRDFVNFVHNGIEGGEKDRLSRSSQLREARPVNTWPLLTGEDIPDGDPASLARIMVVKFGRDTVNPAKLAEAQALAGNLSAVGAVWVDWLESEEGERYAQWAKAQFPVCREKWAKHLYKIEKDAVNRMRVASNLASNQLAFKVASYHPVIGPLIKPYMEHHIQGLKLIAEEMAHSTSQGLEAQRFLDVLRELLVSQKCCFVFEGKEEEAWGEHIGLWRGDGYYLFPDIARQAVAKVLNDDSFAALSSTTLYKQLAELDVIASFDQGRHTKQIRYRGSRVTVLHLKKEVFRPANDSDAGEEIKND